MRHVRTRIVFALCWAVAVAALALPTQFILTGPAHAQQGGGILQFLFQRNETQPRVREAPRVRETPRARTTPRRVRPRTQAPTPATPPPPVAVEKSDDAKTILVIGDFMAGGLADGLQEAYAENTGVTIVERTNGSSGLVRDDYYDWPAEIGAILEAEQPDVVVLLIGSNDRQEMVVDGQRVEPRSGPWLEEYRARAMELATAVRAQDLPLLWVGALPFASNSMSSDMLAFNDIYRQVAEEVGGEFVDVWDGFVDENGGFVTNGPDMNGQPAQLRSSDGINVTSSGKRKLAFYVEKPLNRLLDDPGSPGIARIGPERIFGVAPGVDPAEIERTPPIPLTGPELDGGQELLGGAVDPRNNIEPETVGERLAREGVASEPKPGRADYFGIRRPPEEEDAPAISDDLSTSAVAP